MKGSAGLIIIIGIVAIILFAVYFFRDNLKLRSNSPSPSPAYQSLSQDPKYSEVKEKYNLSEEQLQILSTVNPDDND